MEHEGTEKPATRVLCGFGVNECIALRHHGVFENSAHV